MTVRTDISVDWNVSPRIITVASPSATLTVQDLYDTLRELEDEPLNLTFDRIVSAGGKRALAGGRAVDLTVTMLDAQVGFEARGGPSYEQCFVEGGNLVAVDSVGALLEPINTTAFTQVVRTQVSSSYVEVV